MTIECYYSMCPHHGVHEGEEGPFCFEDECRATPDQLVEFGNARKAAKNTKLKAVRGDLIDLAVAGKFDVIIHGCNCFHIMGGGIAKTIRSRIPEAYAADLKTGHGDPSKLGSYSCATIQTTFKLSNIIDGNLEYVRHNLTVINAYTQYNTSAAGEDVFEYEAFRKVLATVAAAFPGARVGIPEIGMGLAGGNREWIMSIIHEASRVMDLTLVVFQKR